jgi:DNA-binding response OmpR family regulator
MPVALGDSRKAPRTECWSRRVLLLGSYTLLLKCLKQGLEEEGFTVDVASDSPDDNSEVPADYDVIILDLVRPGEAKPSLLQRWRRSGLQTHILVLTPPNNKELEVLDCGFDDSLTKPFDLEELFARLRASLRRTENV